MDYKLLSVSSNDIDKLIEYKLNTIFDYAKELPIEEVDKIKDYVKEEVPKRLNDYKKIVINNKIIGCLLVYKKDDGLLVDEIYLESQHRNKGIGTNIIKKLLSTKSIFYLWVYKQNTKAINLYKKLGFKIIDESETRYYMMYNNKCNKKESEQNNNE